MHVVGILRPLIAHRHGQFCRSPLVEVASIGRETIKLDRMLQEVTEQKDNLPDATSTSKI